ncbi:max dimerization protein 4 [Rhinoraja longicauda]
MAFFNIQTLLEAAEYIERREREAEHGYASTSLPCDVEFNRKKGKTKKAPNNRSSHNELEKHRRAKLRLYLEQLKELVPLGADCSRHTTLSLLKRARTHIKKLEEQDKKALHQKEQLQRERRYLRRRLEHLAVQGLERLRTRSLGSSVSTDRSDSEQEADVDIEGMEFVPGDLDSVGSGSEVDDHYCFHSSSSDSGYADSRTITPRLS